jgi:hypothetical protein
MVYYDELVSERNEDDKRKKREEKMKYKTLSPLSGNQGSEDRAIPVEERKVKARKDAKPKILNTRSLFPNDIF